MPDFRMLQEQTFVAYGDWDASPTKAFMMTKVDTPSMARFIDLAVGRRPREERFVLKSDPHQIDNLADEASLAKIKAELRSRLMTTLRETGDPRVTEKPPRFESMPFTTPRTQRKKNNARNRRRSKP